MVVDGYAVFGPLSPSSPCTDCWSLTSTFVWYSDIDIFLGACIKWIYMECMWGPFDWKAFFVSDIWRPMFEQCSSVHLKKRTKEGEDMARKKYGAENLFPTFASWNNNKFLQLTFLLSSYLEGIITHNPYFAAEGDLRYPSRIKIYRIKVQ